MRSRLLSLKSCCLVVVAEELRDCCTTVGDSGDSAVPSAEEEMVDEGLVMDCCMGESPLELDSLEDPEGGLEAEDDSWQLLVVLVLQDVCPLAKVRGGLGGIGSTCNKAALYYLAKKMRASFLSYSSYKIIESIDRYKKYYNFTVLENGRKFIQSFNLLASKLSWCIKNNDKLNLAMRLLGCDLSPL